MPKNRVAPERAASIHYRIEPCSLHAHLFSVTLTIAKPAKQQHVSLPVWIPGSYLVREFSRNLQNLQASQQGRLLPLDRVAQPNKNSWVIEAAAGHPLVLTYEVYANDPSVRTAFLDAQRGFFNNTSLCLLVQGQAEQPHTLELLAPPERPDWAAATSLRPLHVNTQGFGWYHASNYHELVDGPVMLGDFWSGTFVAGGVPHRFVVLGAAPNFDGQKLLTDAQKICQTQIAFWHGPDKPPFANYLFMLHAAHEGYGGLEHRNGSALICQRKDLPQLQSATNTEGYATLLGLISHEYFHAWNVKRLRPKEFASYDYQQENYTQLLWFFEGFTSYYGDLLLRRAGLLDNAGYLKLLNQTINQVMQAPGQRVQSVAQASFDAWIKYYRPDENTPNATISYYTKGALVALCLDLSLRTQAAKNKAPPNLDQVMRQLWTQCQGGPMDQADVEAALKTVAGHAYRQEIAQWVHGTSDLPLQDLLKAHGVAVVPEPAQLAQQLGLRVREAPGSVVVKTVLRGSAAEQAGFAAGDEWIGVGPVAPPHTQANRPNSSNTAVGWRINKLDDLRLYAQPGQHLNVLVSRDQQLLRLDLLWPTTSTTWRLAIADAGLVGQWLDGAALNVPLLAA